MKGFLYMKIKSIVLISVFIFTFAVFSYGQSKDGKIFQEMVRNILIIGGEVKAVSSDLKPNDRLYIHKQIPSMKETLASAEIGIIDIRDRAQKELNDKDMLDIVNDLCRLQLITINISKELIGVYEANGAISRGDYGKVVEKYEKTAQKLAKKLSKYMDSGK